MLDINVLDDIILSDSELEFIKEEKKVVKNKLKLYERIITKATAIGDILNEIMKTDYETIKREDGQWILCGRFLFTENYNSGPFISEVDEVLNKLDINYKKEGSRVSALVTSYRYEFNVTIEAYEKIEKYLKKVNEITDERLKTKLMKLEIESMPDWKRKYIDSKFKTSNIVKKLNN